MSKVFDYNKVKDSIVTTGAFGPATGAVSGVASEVTDAAKGIGTGALEAVKKGMSAAKFALEKEQLDDNKTIEDVGENKLSKDLFSQKHFDSNVFGHNVHQSDGNTISLKASIYDEQAYDAAVKETFSIKLTDKLAEKYGVSPDKMREIMDNEVYDVDSTSDDMKKALDDYNRIMDTVNTASDISKTTDSDTLIKSFENLYEEFTNGDAFSDDIMNLMQESENDVDDYIRAREAMDSVKDTFPKDVYTETLKGLATKYPGAAKVVAENYPHSDEAYIERGEEIPEKQHQESEKDGEGIQINPYPGHAPGFSPRIIPDIPDGEERFFVKKDNPIQKLRDLLREHNGLSPEAFAELYSSNTNTKIFDNESRETSNSSLRDKLFTRELPSIESTAKGADIELGC